MYCQYQLHCGYDGNQEKFESTIFQLLDNYEKENGVVLTAYFTYGRSVYAGKYPCKGEDIVILNLGTNPARLQDAKPHVEAIACELLKLCDQHVIPYHGVVLAESSFCAK